MHGTSNFIRVWPPRYETTCRRGPPFRLRTLNQGCSFLWILRGRHTMVSWRLPLNGGSIADALWERHLSVASTQVGQGVIYESLWEQLHYNRPLRASGARLPIISEQCHFETRLPFGRFRSLRMPGCYQLHDYIIIRFSSDQC